MKTGGSQYLLCGGPVNVDHRALEAAMAFESGHREPAAVDLFSSTRSGLLELASLQANSHTVVPISGSGTAANEMVLASVVPADGKVLVISNGEFGERLLHIAQTYRDTAHLDFGWGGEVDLQLVRRMIGDVRPDLVSMVHHETSLGLLNPIEQASALCVDASTSLHVDMVSSFGADIFDLASSEIDYVTTSSGKALCSLAGIGIVFAKREALQRLEGLRSGSMYLNLQRVSKSFDDSGLPPNTPALQLFAALNCCVQLILSRGTYAHLQQLKEITDHLRNRLHRDSWQTPHRQRDRSYGVTCVMLPAGCTYQEFADALRHKGFAIYQGKGPYCNSMFQVSCIGVDDHGIVDEFCDIAYEFRAQHAPAGSFTEGPSLFPTGASA